MLSLVLNATQGIRKARDSWGGRVLVMFAIAVLSSSIAKRVFDNTQQARDIFGHRYLISTGTTGRDVGYLLFGIAALLAVHAIFDALARQKFRPFRSLYATMLTMMLAWWVVSVLLRLGAESSDIIQLAIVAIVVVGVVLSPPTWRTLVSLTHVMNVAAAASLVYGLSQPTSQLPCRPDKCGIFGSLMTGFLFQENGAARLVVLLVPATVAIRHRGYLWVSFIVSGLYVAATGSRTSVATWAIAVLFTLVLRRLIGRDASAVRIPALIRFVPLASLMLSLGELLWLTGSALNSRGEIYAGIRSSLHGSALLFGPGPDTVGNLVLAYGARAFGEHGQAPHLLVYVGLPGFLLFAIGVASLVFKRRWNAESAAAFLFVLTAATQFFVEPVWELDITSMSLVVLMVTVGLSIRSHRLGVDNIDDAWPPRRLRRTTSRSLPPQHQHRPASR
jgi:hypothetical protein